MAARYSFEAEARALERAMFFQRFGSVLRATREKTAAAPKKRADQILVDADQCQQQRFHRLKIQVRSFSPASPGFLVPGLGGRVQQVWSPSAKSGRATAACSASNGSVRAPVAGSDFDRPNDAETAWLQPGPSGRPALLQPSEGGNVTGNVCSSAPS